MTTDYGHTEQTIMNSTYNPETEAVRTDAATGMNKTDDSITNYEHGCNASVISKTTAVTIGGGVANDTKLVGLQILAALTGTCVITGFADSDGTAQTITLPAATPAGFVDFKRAKNLAGALTITCSNAGDDNKVCVLWEVNTDSE